MAELARITVGPVHLLAVDADPNTLDEAPQGSLAMDTTGTGKVWQNTDGVSAWTEKGPGSIGSIGGVGVTLLVNDTTVDDAITFPASIGATILVQDTGAP